ncbi:hypothetical protein TcBrA4_0069920 [Trypanosoma cruzi]|nr:hypothetical protein TcBrA4_0069920 [Trypanosoma cruzi]
MVLGWLVGLPVLRALRVCLPELICPPSKTCRVRRRASRRPWKAAIFLRTFSVWLPEV